MVKVIGKEDFGKKKSLVIDDFIPYVDKVETGTYQGVLDEILDGVLYAGVIDHRISITREDGTKDVFELRRSLISEDEITAYLGRNVTVEFRSQVFGYNTCAPGMEHSGHPYEKATRRWREYRLKFDDELIIDDLDNLIIGDFRSE